MSAPAILGLRSSTRQWPNSVPSKLGRQAKGVLVWSTPNPVKRVRTTGNGRKILPNVAWVAPKVEFAPLVERKWLFS